MRPAGPARGGPPCCSPEPDEATEVRTRPTVVPTVDRNAAAAASARRAVALRRLRTTVKRDSRRAGGADGADGADGVRPMRDDRATSRREATSGTPVAARSRSSSASMRSKPSPGATASEALTSPLGTVEPDPSAPLTTAPSDPARRPGARQERRQEPQEPCRPLFGGRYQPTEVHSTGVGYGEGRAVSR